MSGHLGIAVTTATSMAHVLGIARAAHRAGHRVDVFLTGDGTMLTQEPTFAELVELARVGVCDASHRTRGLPRPLQAGLTDRDYVTQARNAELVEECDRYLML